MTPLGIAVVSAAVMVLIDFGWRQLDRRGIHLAPVRRGGSTLQTAAAVGAIVLIAWLLDVAGVLGPAMSSAEARAGVMAVILGLQVATIVALGMLAKGKRPA